MSRAQEGGPEGLIIAQPCKKLPTYCRATRDLSLGKSSHVKVGSKGFRRGVGVGHATRVKHARKQRVS